MKLSVSRWCQEYSTCPHTRESDIFSTRMECGTPGWRQCWEEAAPAWVSAVDRNYRDRDICDISVGQTIIVPFDVMSQHMMVLGLNPRTGTKEVSANPLAVPTEGRTKAQITYDIARTIYVRDGFRGFYRGYVASLCTYVPSSACWWTFYSSYQVGGTDTSCLSSQWWYLDVWSCPCPGLGPGYPGAVCGRSGIRWEQENWHLLFSWPEILIWSGCTTSFITNPLDLVRARVQVCQLFLIQDFGWDFLQFKFPRNQPIDKSGLSLKT